MIKANLETLKKYIDFGFALAAKSIVKCAFIEMDLENRYTTDIKEIEAMIEGKHKFKQTSLNLQGKVNRFSFIPKSKGFFILDIDNKKGVKGFENLMLWAKRKKIDLEIFKKTTYVKTPNNGYHLYFKTGQIEQPLKSEICKGVEIKYNDKDLTAGGSIKFITENGKRTRKEYVLKGDLENALELPLKILEASKVKEKTIKQKQRIYQVHKQQGGKINLELLHQEAQTEAQGHNNRAFKFALKCRKFNYNINTCKEWISSHTAIYGKDKDLETTINRIYDKYTGKEYKRG